MAQDKDSISAGALYTIMGFMLIFGAANTLVMKYMDDAIVDEDTQKKFRHPYFQCSLMFFGELCCLGVYFIKKACAKKEEDPEDPQNMVAPSSPGAQVAEKSGLKTTVNPFMLAIPAFFDFFGSTLMFIGLSMCAASIYQMMRGAIVIITALMAYLFLGRKQYSHHILSLLVIVTGVALVGVASQSGGKDDGAEEDTKPLGIGLIIAAQLFTGGQFVSEEKFLSGYHLDPILAVGLEGMWGCIYYAIFLPVAQHIPCDNADICVNGTLEDSLGAIVDMGKNKAIIAMAAGLICTIAFFNVFGVSITKYASAAQRSTVDTCRTMLVWAVQLATKKETFQPLQLVGFIVLVAGTLVYNEIVELPCEALNSNTKANLAKKKKEEQGGMLDEDQEGEGTTAGGTTSGQEYYGSSPHALYDYNRNKRNLAGRQSEREKFLQGHMAEQMKKQNDDDIHINISEKGSTVPTSRMDN